MSMKILMVLFLMFVAVAPVGAADEDKATSQTEVIVVGDYSRELVDCFYEQNRYLPECKK